MKVVWTLPCLSQEFPEFPKVRQELGDSLHLAYPFELETGDYGSESLIFVGVAGFRYTAARHCSGEHYKALDQLEEGPPVGWRVEATDDALRQYRIFFDDFGCYEFLATDFVPPPARTTE